MQLSLLKKDTTVLYTGFAILIAIVLLNPLPPFFDAKIYLQDAEMLRLYGFSDKFLLSLSGSAGPLYGIVHYIFEPLTHFQAPYIRLVNILFLVGVLYFLKRTLSLPGFSGGGYAIYCMAIPMTYVSAGLVLTEMPAMFFVSMALYLILRTTILPGKSSTQFLSLMLAGICLGLAIIGRQPFLVLLAAMPIVFRDPNWKKDIISLAVLLLFALPIPLYVFWVWQDLVAPYDAKFYDSIAESGTSLRPDFFFMCLAYFAIIFLIIAPGFYHKINKKTLFFLVGIYAIVAIVNYYVHWIEFLPLRTVARMVITSSKGEEIAGYFVGSGMVVIGCYFLFTLYKQLEQSSWNRNLLFYSVMLVFIAISCAKITWGFSSRYPGQAIPLLIPVCSFFRTRTKFSTLLLVIGAAIGIFSLLIYVVMGINAK